MSRTPPSNRLRVVFVMAHDSSGGAARAVFRIFETIREHFGDAVDLSIRAIHKTHELASIVGGKPKRNFWERWRYFIITRFRKYFPRPRFVPDIRLLHSRARHHSGLGRELNDLNPDVVMLGWLGNATLSIEEIGRLKPAVVWRLSDMWMFSGAEHYSGRARYSQGYSKRSRPDSESGPDINRETYRRKLRNWKTPRHVISPSHWMASELQKSPLTKGWPVHVIPNPIDTVKWAPKNRSIARKNLGILQNAAVVLFGAGGGTQFEHKGADLLFDALAALEQSSERDELGPLVLLVFGESASNSHIGTIPVMYLGELDDEALIEAYSAADVMVVPSRLDNFPSTAVEAQSCALPVVGFRVGGLPDIIADGETGKLAEPFDVKQLCDAILWVLSDTERRSKLSQASRERASTLWEPRTIAEQYVDVFFRAANRKRSQAGGLAND